MQKFLGIDIGTTFITVSERTHSSIDVQRYRHDGKIIETIRERLQSVGDTVLCVFTGKAGREVAESIEGEYIDEAVALGYLLSHENRKLFSGDTGHVIDIGASSLTLYTIKGGQVVDISGNTLCAAGTGLFLEEQAERLNLDLEKSGALSIDNPPLIASRCTVFAKSDLIHHQQEGRNKEEMWAGLCRSLVVSAVNTLFRGQDMQGEILLCGGVSLNAEVLRWFKQLYHKVRWVSFPNYSSEALLSIGASYAPGKPKSSLNLQTTGNKRVFKRMPKLSLIRSAYPQMAQPEIDANGLEIRIHGNINETQHVILGMDIGSTSTKLAVINARTKKPLLDIYGRTAGDPVGAARKIFDSLYHIMADRVFHVVAFGTTGSGRKLVGEIFGADVIVNEISAHGAGTALFFPEVETIFEIGGQDAKYICLQRGFVTDVNMNYVCAAGTGSFVEEQARKLGFNIQDVGNITEGIAPPMTSDRCTVFMEQDLRALLKEGFSKEEALAAVLYSVIQNYLNRVVGNRKISEHKIYFQGATARNRGLVAAIENLLGVEVVVSPYCHLMGAIGAALRAEQILTQDGFAPETPSDFIGEEAVHLEVKVRTENCLLCQNSCRINYISRHSNNGGSTQFPEFSWGYQCGRDPHEAKPGDIPYYRLFKERERLYRSSNTHLPIQKSSIKANKKDSKETRGVITVINALTGTAFMPLWKHFFNQLGYRVEVSAISSGTAVKEYASKMATGDFCFPVKVAMGHLVKVLKEKELGKGAFVFLPYMIADKPYMDSSDSFFCPYVESIASVASSMLKRNKMDAQHILAPVVDLRKEPKEIGEMFYQICKDRLEVGKKELVKAFTDAYKEWLHFTHKLESIGSQWFHESVEGKGPVFILLGRPYNLHDKGLNLGIPGKIAAMGYPVIPLDMLRLETSNLSESNYFNVFWKYGQRIMAAIRLAGRYSQVFPIYFSNFNCGPDSFLLSFAEEELKGKPMLVLELDEHDSDGGYLTRIESFLDVVKAYLEKHTPVKNSGLPHIYTAQRRVDLNGKVWIPPIHYYGSSLYAASFRHFGYESNHLESEDQDALMLAKQHLRGGECLPMALTLGAFLKQYNNEKDKNRHHILFMPTTEGPCRFGQYNLLDRIIFNQMGLKNVDIMSPSSVNAYQGLPQGLRRLLMHATMASDVLFKMVTRIRPYERTKGDTDELFQTVLKQLDRGIEEGVNPVKIIGEAAKKFKSIATYQDRKPLVGIVGEIYVRCSAFANGNVVDVIEANGGEAWLSPFHEWILYTAYAERQAITRLYGNIFKMTEALVSNLYIFHIEKKYYEAANDILKDREEPHIRKVLQAGTQYLPEEFGGEAILTIGRSVLFAQQGAHMVVNAAPFGCMPGTIASSILLEIKNNYRIPFVSVFYDGGIDCNDKVASILKNLQLDKTFSRNVSKNQVTLAT